MRKFTDQKFGEAFKDWLKETDMEAKFKATALINAWPELMGPMVARHTKQLYVSNQVLFVTLDSAPLRQELFQSRDKIIQLLNQSAGAELIKDIVFK
jgi:predicted nucleic acid-binding Zn ribbon protein